MPAQSQPTTGPTTPGAPATPAAPGPEGGAAREADLLARARRHLLANYKPTPIVLAEGRGVEVRDVAGRRYLDFCAGVAVCALGHGHPGLAAALARQAGRLMQVSNYFYNEENIELAAELCAATGYDRAFFCNSGAEANEAMLKLARRHFFALGQPERYGILAFDRSFHGRTLGALAMTGNPAYQQGFGPPVAGIRHLPYGDLAAVEQALGPAVAAVIVEPVQGEGGVLPAPAGWLPGLRQLCDRAGALLLVDEVQTGMGRTGRMLGSDHQGVRGDAIALAKGLGGGFPIGAMLCREALGGALPPGTHGSTFGGNPLASHAARTVLRLLGEQGLVDAARERGAQLAAGLAKIAARHPTLCTGERGLGLLRALTLQPGRAARDLLEPCRKRGLLLTAAGAEALRLTPPLVVTAAEIDKALALLDAALGDVDGAA
ncbi:MAG: acetylornithine/succinylornithine family transaminase [Myxococcales bacterium]|nr:acetylornithine/succinylornithine family transaminase [Myxococcales bacterium]